MVFKVKFNDNSQQILSRMERNKGDALTAMGIKAQNLILWQMRQGYGKPIRKTGALQRDLQYEVSSDESIVKVGNTLDYSKYVHEGTRKMSGRPYIRDSLTKDSSKKQILKAAEEYLKVGLE
ncbi:MAG: hypothetical protein IJ461_04100 [Clostridia bacterium]|nr:hypothetical protein [Clostridia bacterium]